MAAARLMRAVWSTKTSRVLTKLPVPAPAAHEVLIRNVAVASNPKDWKYPIWYPGWESVEGNDVAGYIEEVGSGVALLKAGDKVAAYTKMRTAQKYGGYAEFSVSPASTVIPLGPKVSFEEACTLPLAFMTAAIGLYKRLGLPPPEDRPPNPIPVIIYGASSVVGSYAVQLAKLSNLRVIGIAGASADIPRELGADEVIDYRGKTPDQLAHAIGDALDGQGSSAHYAFDCISTADSVRTLGKALAHQGGYLTTVLESAEEAVSRLPTSVTHVGRTAVRTAHGENAAFADHLYKQLGAWVEEGKFRGSKFKVMPGGLAAVDEGLRMLQDGEVRGFKLVYRIADTPA
ncbi:hypothetical protein HWV62_14018 [Athelia sp. TMB]|nr:hypothetical protein HWV62_14018 [Athelia sp. TMB]